MTTMQPEVQDMDTERTLTAQDRCDRCNAPALVVTAHGDLELLWCAHHFTANEQALAASKVLDQRETLNAR